MTALALSLPRMTRVTWYRHRATVLGIVGLLLVSAVLVFIDGVLQRHYLTAHHLAGCLVGSDYYGLSRCENNGPTMAWAEFLNNGRTNTAFAAVMLIPAAVVFFGGLPWVAREFESGAFRFTWTQSVSPARWLLGTFGLLVLLVEVAAALYGLAAQWWYQVAQWRTGDTVSLWSWQSFELTPLSPVSWALLGMALALFLGVTIRRVVPAMIAFVVTAAAGAATAAFWLPSHLFEIGTVTREFRFGTDTGVTMPAWGTDVVRRWFAGPHGRRLDLTAVYGRINWSNRTSGSRSVTSPTGSRTSRIVISCGSSSPATGSWLSPPPCWCWRRSGGCASARPNDRVLIGRCRSSSS